MQHAKTRLFLSYFSIKCKLAYNIILFIVAVDKPHRVLMSVCVSVCVSVLVCVCVCVSVCVHDNSKNNDSIPLNLEHIVVYENSSDEFDIGHSPIKVKVTA